MTEEQIKAEEEPIAENETTKRERSTIQFPYNDLDDAVAIARAIHQNAGTSCTIDQLAAYTHQSMTSGAFRLRVGNAAMFGITVNERGQVTLTELGRRIADPEHEAEARADAFMNVALYSRIFEHYKGYALPPAAALEKFMRESGVSPKQTEKARQAFSRSARQAGYFAHGEDRLVRPALAGTRPPDNNPPPPPKNKNGGGDDGDDDLVLDPLLLALLRKIPPSDAGWPAGQRVRWFRTFAMNVSQIYDEDDGSPPVELDIRIAKGEDT